MSLVAQPGSPFKLLWKQKITFSEYSPSFPFSTFVFDVHSFTYEKLFWVVRNSLQVVFTRERGEGKLMMLVDLIAVLRMRAL